MLRELLARTRKPQPSIPRDAFDKMVADMQTRLDYSHRLLWLAAKSQGGKLVISKSIVMEYGDRVGDLRFGPTEFKGGYEIEALPKR